MCEHQGCHCREAGVERAGKKFCSETCADAQLTGRHSEHCPCGHPNCRAA
jgi:hypothetical protein